MNIIRECDLCKSDKFTPLLTAPDTYLGILGHDFTNVRCNNCGLIFLNPQPNDQELLKHYPNTYYSFATNQRKISFKKFCYRELFIKKSLWAVLLLFPFLTVLKKIKIENGLKILDVGCGSGDLLKIMHDLGMDCYGVEPGNFNQEFAKQNDLKIFQGFLEDAEFQSNFFDCIIMSHSMEHTFFPSKNFHEIKRILKTNGPAIITVPNSDSLGFKIFGKYWASLDPPRHLYNFSAKTLKKYAKLNQLQIKRIRTIAAPFQFINSMVLFARQKKIRLLEKIFSSKIVIICLIPVSIICSLSPFGDTVEITLSKSQN
jgi:2-polyprenyl-3-methyl-5-hydroxy-6-metoxy-1,4-benzoquinol methylase